MFLQFLPYNAPTRLPCSILRFGEQMSDLARELGKRIYLFRKENGLTQAALAEKAKISNEFMSGIERGAKLPSLLTLERLASVLRVNIKDFFNFDHGSYRRIEPLSREGMDIAILLETVPAQKRRRIHKIIKMLVGSSDL
jgi:transcriptional regulator with XRE-family HTH domain